MSLGSTPWPPRVAGGGGPASLGPSGARSWAWAFASRPSLRRSRGPAQSPQSHPGRRSPRRLVGPTHWLSDRSVTGSRQSSESRPRSRTRTRTHTRGPTHTVGGVGGGQTLPKVYGFGLTGPKFSTFVNLILCTRREVGVSLGASGPVTFFSSLLSPSPSQPPLNGRGPSSQNPG